MTISYKITKEKFLEFTKNEPKTILQVMEHFKVAEPTIYKFLKRHNLPLSILCKQNRKISKEKFLEFTKNEPKTMRQVREHFKVHHTTIYNFLKRHNLSKNISCRQKKIILTINKKHMINFQEIKDFVEAELTISSQDGDNHSAILLHKEKGKAIFGDDLNEAIDFIHKSVAIQKKWNGYVHEKTVDILTTMFCEHLYTKTIKKTLDKLKQIS